MHLNVKILSWVLNGFVNLALCVCVFDCVIIEQEKAHIYIYCNLTNSILCIQYTNSGYVKTYLP